MFAYFAVHVGIDYAFCQELGCDQFKRTCE